MNADCRWESETNPDGSPVDSDAVVELELDRVALKAEADLQHLEAEDIEPEQALAYWRSEKPGAAWTEEFNECVKYYETQGETAAQAIQLAAVEAHRLQSAHRIGRQLPAPARSRR